MHQKFRSVKMNAEDYEQLKALCEKTGHRIGFHLGRAISNYLADEAPVWLQKVEEVQRSIRKL